MAQLSPLIVTLDGPAGSGKSSVAHRLARRLGLRFLDTGAMYRGLTAVCLDRGIDPGREPAAVVKLAGKVRMEFDWGTDPPRLYVEGRDVTPRLRDPDVTARVSDVAVLPEVRRVLVRAQQRIGESCPRLISEGRDQGSVVFPGAQVKFYLEASPHVRAKRRAEQLRQEGRAAEESQVLVGIQERDRRDTGRSEGPLICPEDAIRVDTSDLTLDQVVDRLEAHVRTRYGEAVAGPGGGRSSDAAGPGGPR